MKLTETIVPLHHLIFFAVKESYLKDQLNDLVGIGPPSESDVSVPSALFLYFQRVLGRGFD